MELKIRRGEPLGRAEDKRHGCHHHNRDSGRACAAAQVVSRHRRQGIGSDRQVRHQQTKRRVVAVPSDVWPAKKSTRRTPSPSVAVTWIVLVSGAAKVAPLVGLVMLIAGRSLTMMFIALVA